MGIAGHSSEVGQDSHYFVSHLALQLLRRLFERRKLLGDMPALPLGLVHAALPPPHKPCPPSERPAAGAAAVRAFARRPSTFMRTASTAYAHEMGTDLKWVSWTKLDTILLFHQPVRVAACIARWRLPVDVMAKVSTAAGHIARAASQRTPVRALMRVHRSAGDRSSRLRPCRCSARVCSAPFSAVKAAIGPSAYSAAGRDGVLRFTLHEWQPDHAGTSRQQ